MKWCDDCQEMVDDEDELCRFCDGPCELDAPNESWVHEKAEQEQE